MLLGDYYVLMFLGDRLPYHRLLLPHFDHLCLIRPDNNGYYIIMLFGDYYVIMFLGDRLPYHRLLLPHFDHLCLIRPDNNGYYIKPLTIKALTIFA